MRVKDFDVSFLDLDRQPLGYSQIQASFPIQYDHQAHHCRVIAGPIPPANPNRKPLALERHPAVR